MTDMQDFNRQLIEEYRANGGKVLGQFAGAPLLLLTTTGAKSGKARTTPLVYTEDGDQLVIIASKGGAPTNPDWYYNLVANPTATVELGEDQFAIHAVIHSDGKERDRLFDQTATQMPNFAEYQRNTTRTIPVVVLARAS